jgi:hypothetical protein
MTAGPKPPIGASIKKFHRLDMERRKHGIKGGRALVMVRRQLLAVFFSIS